jgi:hypothetical protein
MTAGRGRITAAAEGPGQSNAAAGGPGQSGGELAVLFESGVAAGSSFRIAGLFITNDQISQYSRQ